MKILDRTIERFRAVLDDTYLGFVIEPNVFGASNLAAVLRFLAVPQRTIPCISSTVSSYTDLAASEGILRRVSREQIHSVVRQTIAEAVQYGWGRNDEVVDALSDAFLMEFNEPAVFANFSPDHSAFTGVTHHSRDWLVCCVDRDTIGCLITADDE